MFLFLIYDYAFSWMISIASSRHRLIFKKASCLINFVCLQLTGWEECSSNAILVGIIVSCSNWLDLLLSESASNAACRYTVRVSFA